MVYRELLDAKPIIEKELNKTIKDNCWPGGGFNEHVLAVAKRLGSKSWTLASKDRSSLHNLPGRNPRQVKRMGAFALYHSRRGADCGYAGQYYSLSSIARDKVLAFGKWTTRLLRYYGLLQARLYGISET